VTGWEVANKIIGLNKPIDDYQVSDLGLLGFFLAFLRGVIGTGWFVCWGHLALVSKSVPGRSWPAGYRSPPSNAWVGAHMFG